MRKKTRLILLAATILLIVALTLDYLLHINIAVLQPKGPIASRERGLIIFTLLLSLVVVLPVFIMTTVFAWRYREGNTEAKYSPDLDHSLAAETIWWLIPTALIAVLSIVTWNSSHNLDPFKPLISTKKPITIQVVALDWKWLFIYPKQHIASVNRVQFPVDTPINFEITSDAPMNSFWIPQLAGQIYAMPGMSTELKLEASEPGSYFGSSANISGEGFANMKFTAQAGSVSEFNHWVSSIKKQPNRLTLQQYEKLAKPSLKNQVAYYSWDQPELYDSIMMKYMMHTNEAFTP